MTTRMSNTQPTKPINLAVPGGLAGQLFAIGYAAWIADKRKELVHIQFYDGSHPIGKLSAGGVLESDLAKQLGISYSVSEEGWPPTKSKKLTGLGPHLLSKLSTRRLSALAEAVMLGGHMWLQSRGTSAPSKFEAVISNSISKDTLLEAKPGTTILGFPTDYRIIEESWGMLSDMIASSGYPNFAHGTGAEDSVAVHWRLGDYVKNDFHGAVAWSSLRNCLRYANSDNKPIKLFTDSPDLAEQTIRESRESLSYQIVSGDIWSDLYGMTRSRVFVGSHSGVSFLAALALRSNNPSAKTWLPDRWFRNPGAEYLFQMPPQTSQGSALYPAELVTSAVPL